MVTVANAYHKDPRYFSSVLSVPSSASLFFFLLSRLPVEAEQHDHNMRNPIIPLCIHCPAGYFLSFLFSLP